jgi:hypothetical protein
MQFAFNAAGNGSVTGSTVELGKWIATVSRTAWRRISYPFQALARRRNCRGTLLYLPDSNDAPLSCNAPQKHRRSSPAPENVLLLSKANWQSRLVNDHGHTARSDASDRLRYLLCRENSTPDIRKLNSLLRMPQVLLEIGCGDGEAARRIALKNPGIGVIATDLYDWSHQPSNGSGYGKIARAWRARQLSTQTDSPANLVVLRAEADFLRCLPVGAVDTILMINPEPRVGKSFLDLLQGESLNLRIKQGPNQIVILPYSRELGVAACGGCSFEHDRDWSKGLGFILGSGLGFRRSASVYWGVDLSRISAYTGNSTQRDIYVCGQPAL